MEVVALGVGHAEPGREEGTDGGLPGARDAHHHDDMGGACLLHPALAVFFDMDSTWTRQVRRHVLST